LERTDNQQWRK